MSKHWDSLKLCKNPDGSTLLLGQGNYGMVRMQTKPGQSPDWRHQSYPTAVYQPAKFVSYFLPLVVPEEGRSDTLFLIISQVYKGILNKTTSVAVKTFSHRGTDQEVIRFNAVSSIHLSAAAAISQKAAEC